MDFDALLTRLKSLGTTKLMLFGGASLGVLSLLIMLLVQMGQSPMSLLSNDLSPQETSKVLEQLGSQSITFEVKGNAVYVADTELLRARMFLAESGVPTGSAIGYEIFDKSDVLGTTSFVQNVNLVRALEGELARTIQTIKQISHVRVHIVMPERKIFSKEKRKPSAAVALRMRGGNQLSDGQVQAIRSLISSAVPELKMDDVSVLDDRGVLLASSTDKNGRNIPREAEERRIVYEARLSRMIESLFEQSLGAGNVRAEISAELDYDQITEQSEVFDPNGQVVRSAQAVSDENQSKGSSTKPTSVQEEMPNVQQNRGDSGGPSSDAKRTEETTNYEISKKVKTAVKELGRVKRLSVAVVINGIYDKNDQGEESYKERSEEEMEKYKSLIKAVVGYKEERGDVVDVVNLRFQKTPDQDIEEQGLLPQLSEKSTLHLLELGLLAILLLVLFFFGVRPYLMSLHASQTADAAAQTAQENENAGTQEDEASRAAQQKKSEFEDWENLPEDELRALVSKLALAQPERAASIVRLWMKG